jgi:NADH:ubiquinone oxidoreductase subunit 5 (subunit L)/multisubunit Na+/H+ antiporter MnhA subunit
MNLGGVLSGLALAKAPQVFRGAGAMLIAPLVTAGFAAWEMGVGWPVYVTNSSHADMILVNIGAIAAITTSVVLVRTLGRIAFPEPTTQPNIASQAQTSIQPPAAATRPA